MEKTYQNLIQIEEDLKSMVEKSEVEFATTLVDFFKTLPNQRETELSGPEARMIKVRVMYLLERLVDLEKDGQNRLRVLSFIDNTLIGLAKILAGNRDGTILDESLVNEAEVDANLAVQQKQLGVILETQLGVPMDKIPKNHPQYDEMRKKAINMPNDGGDNIIIVPKRK